MKELIRLVESELLGKVSIKSIHNSEPVVVTLIPDGWELIGNGNYAGVFFSVIYPEYVVKVYADGREGIEEEKLVYQKLGKHESFSECLYYDHNYLILKRLKGKTLYQCLKKGIYIPQSVINEIDAALKYAESKGLHPHDIHFKNVMMDDNGKGIVVDISDFMKEDFCSLWDDSKKYYYNVYSKFPVVPLPDSILNLSRKIYRLYKKLFS